MRLWSFWKLGRPSGPKATTSPSTIASWLASARPRLAQLGIAGRDVAPAARAQPEAAALGVADRAHAVPLDLVRPVLVVPGQRPGAREHRLDLLGHRLPVRILRRIHPVDHPVAAVGAEQHVAALDALPREGDHHLVLAPLVQLVGAAVPDLHRSRAVLALRDLAVEVEVLERVVLGTDREVVALRILRDPLRDRPRSQRAVVLEPQVPVQRPGVVLLHHEPRRGVVVCAIAARRLRGGGEIPLAAVRIEVVGHELAGSEPSELGGGGCGYRACPYGSQSHRARRHRGGCRGGRRRRRARHLHRPHAA